jgi:hypothetical protein
VLNKFTNNFPQTLLFELQAQSNTKITRVELLVDGDVVRTDPSPSPQVSFTLIQTWKATPGTHTLGVRAYNTSGAASDPAAGDLLFALLKVFTERQPTFLSTHNNTLHLCMEWLPKINRALAVRFCSCMLNAALARPADVYNRWLKPQNCWKERKFTVEFRSGFARPPRPRLWPREWATLTR